MKYRGNASFPDTLKADHQSTLEQHRLLLRTNLLDEVFAVLPVIVLIVNEYRQIVFVSLPNDFVVISEAPDSLIGLRPGEFLGCQNASRNIKGCGASEECSFCGIYEAFSAALINQNVINQETSIEIKLEEKILTFDFLVSAKPFRVGKKQFVMMTLENIGQTKRREYLERTFFHDLMNRVMSLSGILELIGLGNSEMLDQLMPLLRKSVADLTNEVVFQRSLSEAESGDFSPKWDTMNSLELLGNLKKEFANHETLSSKVVSISEETNGINFLSDRVILNRILYNLIKNAFEAIEPGQHIVIGSSAGHDQVFFWVQSPNVMPEEIRLQVFKRSFTTKGQGRGMGTYVVKLFAERYLHGSVSFVSEAGCGTIFHLKFPLNPFLQPYEKNKGYRFFIR
jgi:signal transduction histidine kinase